MKHILIIPSWFPSRVAPLTGDFVERHALSISIYNKVTVLFAIKDVTAKKSNWVEIRYNENLTAHIYYYTDIGIPLIGKLFSGLRRFIALRRMFNEKFKSQHPDIVHLHVAYPAGIFALYLLRFKGLQYVITEQNGLYMPQYDHMHRPGFFERRMTRIIFRRALGVHAVSRALADALKTLKLISRDPVVIPNVVDVHWFSYLQQAGDPGTKFIHVSTLTHQKNPDGMLRALALVKQERNDFSITIVGPAPKHLKKLTAELQLDNQVKYMGELTYQGVARAMQHSDAMLFFTRYETFGCVIAESLCCGVPVIASDLDVTRENIQDQSNGMLVQSENVRDLADKILAFMNQKVKFDRPRIAAEAKEKFNYNRAGKMFDHWYRSILP